MDSLRSIADTITQTLSNARAGDVKSIAAVAGAGIVSVLALRRLVSNRGPRKQANGGIGGDFEFVDPRGKCVVVTGCDSGFGYLTAIELARLGFTVFAGLYAEPNPKTSPAAELAALEKDRNARNITGVEFGKGDNGVAPLGKIICFQLDVTKDESVNAFFEAVTSSAEFKSCQGAPGIYAVINVGLLEVVGRSCEISPDLRSSPQNAGINAGYLVEMSTIAHMEQNMAVNYYGAARMMLKFLPLLRRYGADHKANPNVIDKPRLVNITSGAGIMVTSPLGPYAASKHALEALTDATRQDLLHYGHPVHCTLIEPTIALTPIVTTDLSAQWDKYVADNNISPEIMEAYGGYEYQKAQWCLSAVHLKAKPGTSMILRPEDVVRSIVEETAKKRGMKIRRPVPDFGMGLVCGFRFWRLGDFWAVNLTSYFSSFLSF